MGRPSLERRLLDFFASLDPAPTRCWAAVSGGGDSVALFHLLAELAPSMPWSLGIVHVHHGLHAEADEWERRVKALAEAHAVPIQVFHVDARPRPGTSPEAAAREARYGAWRDWLAPGEAVVTAHHADDQAETLLLQLLRGAGPHGLAAMPAVAGLGHGHLLRPLLETDRETIRRWAGERGLEWIEDPSNLDLRHDRNYLRYRILPGLRERWPSLAATLHRAATLQAEAAGLLDALAEADLAACRRDGLLQAHTVLGLPEARQRNLLRYWIASAGHPIPSRAVIERIRQDVLGARPDAEPRVRWADSEVRRHRGRVYLLHALPDRPPADIPDWDLQPRYFPELGRTLRLAPAVGEGIAMRRLESGRWSVRFRRGGERIRPAGQAHHRPLKHLLQEAGMPPWERRILPLIWCDETLVAVPGICVAEGWQAEAGEAGQVPVWEPAPPVPLPLPASES